MCGLFSLPLELIRVSLQYISLRDIARLILAVNNRQQYEMLTEAIQGMKYTVTGSFQFFPDSVYDWAAAWDVRLSAINTYIPIQQSDALVRYLEKYGSQITHLDVIFHSEGVQEICQGLSIITHLTPNAHHIQICCKEKLFNNIIPALHTPLLKTLSINIYRATIDLSRLLHTFPELEVIHHQCGELITTGLEKVYPKVTCIDKLNIQYSHYFPNNKSGIFMNDGSNEPKLQSTLYQQITVLSFHSYWTKFKYLQSLLDVMPALTKLSLTEIQPMLALFSYQDKKLYVNITSINLKLTGYDSQLFEFISICCPNLTFLSMRFAAVMSQSETRNVCQYLLQHCQKLHSLDVTGIVNSLDTVELIQGLLGQTHDHIAYIRLNIPTITYLKFDAAVTHQSLLSKLREIVYCGRITPEIYPLLRQCPSLSHFTLNDEDNELKIKMLYEVSDWRTGQLYEQDKHGYRLLQHSHSQLQDINIRGDVNGDWNVSEVVAIFPCLHSLTISGCIDCDSWNRILAKSEFTIHRLTVSDSGSLEAIMDSLLHHRNFRELQYVFCNKMDYSQLKELEAIAAGRERHIQFHNRCWIKSSDF